MHSCLLREWCENAGARMPRNGVRMLVRECLSRVAIENAPVIKNADLIENAALTENAALIENAAT